MDSQRLEKILTDKGIKQTWVAEKLGVSPALVNQWVKNTKPIPEEFQKRLQLLLN